MQGSQAHNDAAAMRPLQAAGGDPPQDHVNQGLCECAQVYMRTHNERESTGDPPPLMIGVCVGLAYHARIRVLLQPQLAQVAAQDSRTYSGKATVGVSSATLSGRLGAALLYWCGCPLPGYAPARPD